MLQRIACGVGVGQVAAGVQLPGSRTRCLTMLAIQLAILRFRVLHLVPELSTPVSETTEGLEPYQGTALGLTTLREVKRDPFASVPENWQPLIVLLQRQGNHLGQAVSER